MQNNNIAIITNKIYNFFHNNIIILS